MSTKTTPDLESALDNLDPQTVEVLDPRELRDIATAVDSLTDAQRQVDAAVLAAHGAGYSWGKIAIALGVSRQSAHERYRGRTGT